MQAIGLVTDVGFFLERVARELLDASEPPPRAVSSSHGPAHDRRRRRIRQRRERGVHRPRDRRGRPDRPRGPRRGGQQRRGRRALRDLGGGGVGGRARAQPAGGAGHPVRHRGAPGGGSAAHRRRRPRAPHRRGEAGVHRARARDGRGDEPRPARARRRQRPAAAHPRRRGGVARAGAGRRPRPRLLGGSPTAVDAATCSAAGASRSPSCTPARASWPNFSEMGSSRATDALRAAGIEVVTGETAPRGGGRRASPA